MLSKKLAVLPATGKSEMKVEIIVLEETQNYTVTASHVIYDDLPNFNITTSENSQFPVGPYKTRRNGYIQYEKCCDEEVSQ